MKLKKLCSLALATAMLFSAAPVYAQDINVSINGNVVSFPNQRPVIVDGRTLIPVRGIFDNLGYTIDWDANTKTVTLTKDSDKVQLVIGVSAYVLNGTSFPIDVPAQIINSSTMIPLRAVADATGYEVLWDSNTKLATIVDKSSITTEVPKGIYTAKTLLEKAYMDAYTAVFEKYNGYMTEFISYTGALTPEALSNSEKIKELADKSQQALGYIDIAIKGVSALNCPERFQNLQTTTLDYLNTVRKTVELFHGIATGDITLEQYANTYQSVASDLMVKEQQYKTAFENALK